MEVWEFDGRLFEVVTLSDVVRDGMAMELTDLSGAPGAGPVMEAFFHDAAPGFDLIIYSAAVLPFPIVERFVDEARRMLPPEPSHRGQGTPAP